MNAYAYVAYLRPLTFLPTFLLTLTGYAQSAQRPSGAGALLTDLVTLFLVHSVLLWGGANAGTARWLAWQAASRGRPCPSRS